MRTVSREACRSIPKTAHKTARARPAQSACTDRRTDSRAALPSISSPPRPAETGAWWHGACRALLPLVLITGCASPLAAADLPVIAPIVPAGAGPDWNGFYVGGHIGVADDNAQYNYSTVFSGAPTNHTTIGRINGEAFGAYGGFNYQINRFVVGLEGDVTFTDGMFRLNGPNFDFLQASNAIYGGGVRAGVLVTPTTLVYGKVGYVGIQLSGIQGFGDTFHQTTGGTQVAAGIENLISNNLLFRLEANYTSGNNTLNLNDGFDRYRPSFFWVTAGLAVKLDPLPAHEVEVKPLSSFVTHDPRWTSVYVGGLAGIAAGQVTRYDQTFGLMGPYNTLRFAGGGMVGGDVQLWRIVVGAQFDTLFTHATFTDDVGVGLGPIYNQFARISRVSAVTGRAGFLISPETLLYGKAGPAQIRFTPNADYFAAINPTVTTTPQSLRALQYGFGMESYIADHVAVRVEGLYTRALEAVTIDGVVPAQTKLQPSTLTGTLGLVLKY